MSDKIDDGGPAFPVSVGGKGNAARKYWPGMERQCPRCARTIVVTEKMVAARKYACGPCQSAAAVEYAKRNRERKRATNNAYHARISNKRAEATAAYRARHPEKHAAHQAVQTALRNGTLQRQPCQECGSPKAHAHHDDYTLPLAVNWLCHSHHMERHAMLAARAKGGAQ